MDHSKAIYLSDLSGCIPSLALSNEHRKYHWQVVPYEAEGISGNLLIAGPETEAPPVTLPLAVSGWYAIFLGLWSNWTPTRLRVKLTSDPAFVHVTRETEGGATFGNNFFVDERFWKARGWPSQPMLLM